MSTILDIGEIEDIVVLFGGIYGNIEAMSAFVSIMEEHNINANNIIFSGDCVGYGADSEACVQIVKELGIHCIKGDLDESISVPVNDIHTGLGEAAEDTLCLQDWYPLIQDEVSQENKDFLTGLPNQIRFGFKGNQCLVVHGGIRRSNTPHYPSAEISHLSKEISAAPESVNVIIAGHTSFPMMRLPDQHLWHNTGAIGMPANDGTPRGWFTVLSTIDDGRLCIDLHDLHYDHEAAAKKIRDSHRPEAIATMLENGYLPHRRFLNLKEQAVQGLPIESRAFAWPPR